MASLGARADIAAVLLLVAVLLTCPLQADEPNGAERHRPYLTLVRKDRLPAFPHDAQLAVSGYACEGLPATETRFMVVRETANNSLPGRQHPAHCWVSTWGEEPLQDAVAQVGVYGSAAVVALPDGSASAMEISCPLPGTDTYERRLFIFRDLHQAADIAVSPYRTSLIGISPHGTVVCRLEDKPDTAVFFAPNTPVKTLTCPGTFLNWDFAHEAIIYSDDKTVYVAQGERIVLEATLPFTVDRATPLPHGRLLVGSRNIGGDEEPVWRILLDQDGKHAGEAFFAGWHLFPDALSWRGKERRIPNINFVTRDQGQIAIRRLHDLRRIGRQHHLLDSTAFHPYICLDSRGNIYRLMDSEVGDTVQEQPMAYKGQWIDMLHASLGLTPAVTLLDHRDIARELDAIEAVITSMTVSPDGNRLAVTANANGHWWILQFRVSHVMKVPI